MSCASKYSTATLFATSAPGGAAGEGRRQGCHTRAPAASATAAAMPAATVRGRRRKPGLDLAPDPSSAAANSAALAKRSAGTFASAFATALSMLAGTPSRTVRSGVGRSVSTRAMIICDVCPVCGGSPTSIS